MSERGVYRGIYSALVDDPEYQLLSAKARLVFLTVRICVQAGPACIFRYYPALLAAQAGLSVRDVEAALVELERSPSDWLRREGPVIWVRNALRHDPNMHLTNDRHRVAVENWLRGLPRLQIVLTFCEYYQIAKPFERVSIASPIASRYIGVEAGGVAVGVSGGESGDTAGVGTDGRERHAASVPAHTNGFKIPESVTRALDRVPRLERIGKFPRLRSDAEWWQAQIRAFPGLDLASCVLKAESWLASHPQEAARKRNAVAFLHNWFAREGQ